MSRRKYYDVKNTVTGKEYLNVTATQIQNEIIGKKVNITQIMNRGQAYKEWVIKECPENGEKKREIYPFTEDMVAEWKNVQAVFRRVEWVKDGGKKLQGVLGWKRS